MEPIKVDPSPESDSFSSLLIEEYRNVALASVRELYSRLQEDSKNLSKEECSHRLAFLDELTKDVRRFICIPDEKVEGEFHCFLHKASETLRRELLEHVIDGLFSRPIKANQRIRMTLNWETVTLVDLLDYLNSSGWSM